jgi:hypothetical protein
MKKLFNVLFAQMLFRRELKRLFEKLNYPCFLLWLPKKLIIKIFYIENCSLHVEIKRCE